MDGLVEGLMDGRVDVVEGWMGTCFLMNAKNKLD